MQTRANTSHIWRFGVFEVDPHNLELCRNGTPVKLREQSFRILLFLLEHAGEIVTREELRLVLWPSDIYVDFDHSLNTAVMKLRHALGDSADAPLYIETVPKRGYRFIAPITGIPQDSQPLPPPDTAPHTPALTPAARPDPSSEGDLPTTVPNIPDHPALSPALPHRSHRSHPIRDATASLLLLAIAGCALFFSTRQSPPHDGSAKQALSQPSLPLISPDHGDSVFPVFSPDSHSIAFVSNGSDRRRYDLYLQALGSGIPQRLTYSKGGLIGPPAWSPDGSEIAFSRCDGQDDGLFVVSAQGGPERRVTGLSCLFTFPGPVAWLPDADNLLLVDHCVPNGPFGVVLFSLPTGNKRCLTGGDGPNSSDSGFGFALSPDATILAYKSMTGSLCCDIYAIPLTGGVPRQLTSEAQLDCNSLTEFACTDLMWTPDSRSVIFASNRMGVTSLWRVPANSGLIERDTSYPGIGSFSKDGTQFAYSQNISPDIPSIWKADLARPAGPVLNNRRVISTQFPEMNAQPSPDGAQLAWTSIRTGFQEIWKADPAGSHPIQLTHLYRSSGAPRWSPDGKWIAFDSYSRDSAQILLTDPAGTTLRPITDDPSANLLPSWSRDSRSILFSSKRTGSWQIWRHSLANGVESPLTRHGGLNPFESSDGTTVFFSRMDRPGIWSIPSRGGPESAVLRDKPQLGYWGDWALTRPGIYLLNTEAAPGPAIEFYDFATHHTRPILTLKQQPTRQQPGLSATPDGRTIYYTQYDRQSTIKLLSLAR